jgi:hypothetical protein
VHTGNLRLICNYCSRLHVDSAHAKILRCSYVQLTDSAIQHIQSFTLRSTVVLTDMRVSKQLSVLDISSTYQSEGQHAQSLYAQHRKHTLDAMH